MDEYESESTLLMYNDGQKIYIETECDECDEPIIMAFTPEQLIPFIERLEINVKAILAANSIVF